MQSVLVPPPVGLVNRIPVYDEPEPKRIVIKTVTRKSVVKVKTKAIRVKQQKVRRPSRRVYVLKTHCINGHELVEGNLYYPKTGRRKRECRTCIRNRVLKYKAKVAKNETL